MATYGEWLNSPAGGLTAQQQLGSGAGQGFMSAFGGGGGMGGMGGGNAGWVQMMMKGLGAAANKWAEGFPTNYSLSRFVKDQDQHNLTESLQREMPGLLDMAKTGVADYRRNVAQNTPAMQDFMKRIAGSVSGSLFDSAYDPNNLLRSSMQTYLKPIYDLAVPSIENAATSYAKRAALASGTPTGAMSSGMARALQNLTADRLLPAISNAMGLASSSVPMLSLALRERLNSLYNAPAAMTGAYGQVESRPLAGYQMLANALANQMGLYSGLGNLLDQNSIYQLQEKPNWLKTATEAAGAALSSAG